MSIFRSNTNVSFEQMMLFMNMFVNQLVMEHTMSPVEKGVIQDNADCEIPQKNS
jgi:hypothetical protein